MLSGFSAYFFISPIAGAVIGYFTNWVAIKMMFRPHTEKFFLGRRVPFTPGIIPKRRDILAKKVGDTVSQHLLTDETMIKSLCSEDVKKSIADILRGMYSEAKKSERTAGSLIFRDKSSQAMAKALTEKAADYLLSEDFLFFIRRYETELLNSDKKIGEYVPAEVTENVKTQINQNMGPISDKIIDVVQSDFFVEKIRPLIIGLINDNVKGLASLFVIPEKVYQNFLEKVIEYLDDTQNHQVMADKLIELYDKALALDVSAAAKAVANEDGQIISPLIEKEMNNTDDAAAAMRESIKQRLAGKLETTVLSLRVCDILAKLDDRYIEQLIDFAMSKYESLVREQLPPLLISMNISGIVEDKINSFEMQEAEDIILDVVDRELKAITYFGGVLGFVIGVVPAVLQSIGL